MLFIGLIWLMLIGVYVLNLSKCLMWFVLFLFIVLEYVLNCV